ncbi:SWIM zinc finger family protein [Halomonas halophila]|uniref:SWIM zinc finger family protein n=2 Tax=Halomonadaceae TaxID=28256 RepID=UPI0011BF72CD
MSTTRVDSALLSDRQLIRLAGEAAFGRGVAYYHEGMVVGWHQSGTTITADVEGGERYRVVLELSAQGLDGSCDCPASQGIDFCKHCVAVALSYRTNEAEQARLTEGDATDRIHAYLQQMDKSSLIEALQSLIEHDPILRQQWSLRADAVLGVLDIKTLKKRITAAFPVNRDLYRYEQVNAYFARAEAVVEQLAEQAPQLPADQCLTLVDYALSRMARALETVDDSGGFRFHCEHILHDLHVRTVRRLDWSPGQLAAYLYDKAFGGSEDSYPPIPDAYAEALGEAGMAAYHACLQRAWDDLPALPKESGWMVKYRYIRLRAPLLKLAEADGDLPAMLALYEKTASDEKDCLDAAKACIAHEAWDQLETWLARAKRATSQQNPHQQVERQRLEVRLYLQRGEGEAAAALLWDIYQHTRQLEDYRRLVTLADDRQLATDYRRCAHDWLVEGLDEESQRPFGWGPRMVDSLLEVYLFEGRLDEARALCAERAVMPALLHQLAQATKELDESLPLYLRLVRHEVQKTNNQAYRDGIALLQELDGRLDSASQRETFQDALIQLRTEFKPKRNFIKWLKEAFPEP